MRGVVEFWRSIGPWRLLWATMALAHAAPTIDAWFIEPSLSSAVLLALTQAFFILKLIDVPWLRVRMDRRALWGVALVVVLLHARAVESSLPHPVNTIQPWHVALVGGLLAPGLIRALRRRLDRTTDSAWRAHQHSQRAAVVAWLTDALLPPRYLALQRGIQVDRAPPARPLYG